MFYRFIKRIKDESYNQGVDDLAALIKQYLVEEGMQNKAKTDHFHVMHTYQISQMTRVLKERRSKKKWKKKK